MMHPRILGLFPVHSPYKKNLNSEIRTYSPKVTDISAMYLEGKKNVNNKYNLHVETVIEKCISLIKEYGGGSV
jgi:hypothetical protein